MRADWQGLVVIAWIAACRSSPTFPADVPGVRITDGDFANQYSQRTERSASGFRFDRAGVNGTALVMRYLQNAERRGAKYVSELALAVQFTHDGVPMECTSRIVVENGRTTPAVERRVDDAVESNADAGYMTIVRPWRPDTVASWVVDKDLVCERVSEQIVVWEPKYSSRTSAEVPRYIEPGQMPMERNAKIVWSNVCRSEPTRRYVHRYAHFVAARFTPPDWERIGKAYSDWRLTEAPPICHPIVHPPSGFVQRIEADLHFIGSLGTAAQLPDIMTK